MLAPVDSRLLEWNRHTSCVTPPLQRAASSEEQGARQLENKEICEKQKTKENTPKRFYGYVGTWVAMIVLRVETRTCPFKHADPPEMMWYIQCAHHEKLSWFLRIGLRHIEPWSVLFRTSTPPLSSGGRRKNASLVVLFLVWTTRLQVVVWINTHHNYGTLTLLFGFLL